LKNAKRAKRRRNTENHARNPLYQRNLNNAFTAAEDREYHTTIGTIAEAALLAQQLPPNPQIQRLQYLTQRTLVQLDGQHPMSSTQTRSQDLSTMVTLHRLVAPLEEVLDIGGTTIASATRTIQSATAIPRASSSRVATLNKRCNN
jgi:hypothetical protein